MVSSLTGLCFALLADQVSALSMRFDHQAKFVDQFVDGVAYQAELEAAYEAKVRDRIRQFEAQTIKDPFACNLSVHSNLGGMGPEAGAANLRFYGAHEYYGQKIDLVVTALTPYEPSVSAENGLDHKCFGFINLATKSSEDTSVALEFKFVKTGTDEVFEVPMLLFNVWNTFDCKSCFGDDAVDYNGDASEAICKPPLTPITYWDAIADEATYWGNETTVGEFTDPDGLTVTPTIYSYRGPKAFAENVHIQYTKATTWKMNFASNAKVDCQRNIHFGIHFYHMDGEHPCSQRSEGSCMIWGDPHIIPFDLQALRVARHPLREAVIRTRQWKADQLNAYDAGVFWLVNSAQVKIQARYTKNLTNPDFTNLQAVAIGGPFLDGNTLVFKPKGFANQWNNETILESAPSLFKNEMVTAFYHNEAQMIKDGKSGPGIDVFLPLGVKLVVNRWRENLAVKIHMCPQEGGQSGQCGDFNGVWSDEAENFMKTDHSSRVNLVDEFLNLYSDDGARMYSPRT